MEILQPGPGDSGPLGGQDHRDGLAVEHRHVALRKGCGYDAGHSDGGQRFQLLGLAIGQQQRIICGEVPSFMRPRPGASIARDGSRSTFDAVQSPPSSAVTSSAWTPITPGGCRLLAPHYPFYHANWPSFEILAKAGCPSLCCDAVSEMIPSPSRRGSEERVLVRFRKILTRTWEGDYSSVPYGSMP
jgi:hypothetical protein